MHMKNFASGIFRDHDHNDRTLTEINKTIYRALQSKTPIAEIPTLNNSVSRTYRQSKTP